MALNTYALVISYNSAGQFAQNVLHYQFDDAAFNTSKDAAEELMLQFFSARQLTLRNCLPSDCTILSAKCIKITGVGGFEAFAPVTGVGTGIRPGTQSASALNPVIIHLPLAFSRARGKTFIPGISETDIEDGKYTEAYKNAIATQLATLFDNLTLTGGVTATYGWVKGKPPIFVQAAEVFLSPNLGTLRRRMRPV